MDSSAKLEGPTHSQPDLLCSSHGTSALLPPRGTGLGQPGGTLSPAGAPLCQARPSRTPPPQPAQRAGPERLPASPAPAYHAHGADRHPGVGSHGGALLQLSAAAAGSAAPERRSRPWVETAVGAARRAGRDAPGPELCSWQRGGPSAARFLHQWGGRSGSRRVAASPPARWGEREQLREWPGRQRAREFQDSDERAAQAAALHSARDGGRQQCGQR